MLAWVLALLSVTSGGRVLGDELGVARDVALGLLELGLGAGEQAFDLLDLRFDRAAVEREQEIALVHQRAVAEMHAGDLAVDARLDRDAGDRGHGAERLDANRNGLLDRGRDLDRDARGAVLARAPARRRRPTTNRRVSPRRSPAAASTTTAPTTNVRFFITVPRRPSIGPPGLPLFPGAPLITILFGMRAKPSNISL